MREKAALSKDVEERVEANLVRAEAALARVEATLRQGQETKMVR